MAQPWIPHKRERISHRNKQITNTTDPETCSTERKQAIYDLTDVLGPAIFGGSTGARADESWRGCIYDYSED